MKKSSISLRSFSSCLILSLVFTFNFLVFSFLSPASAYTILEDLSVKGSVDLSGYNLTFGSDAFNLGKYISLNFNQGGSVIYDDTNLHVETDDNLWLDAPGTTYVENDMALKGNTLTLAYDSNNQNFVNIGKTITLNFNQGDSSIYDDTNLHLKTDDNMWLDVPDTVYVENQMILGGDLRALSFIGPLTGDVTGNVSGTSGGLTGNPSISVTNLTATGTITFPDDSLTDSMIPDTITASNYLPLSGGTLSGDLNLGTNNISNVNTLTASSLLGALTGDVTGSLSGGSINTTGFTFNSGATAGYVLTTDASGIGSWTDLSSTGGPWTLSESNLYPDDTSYNVGIGTTNPTALLTLQGTNSTATEGSELLTQVEDRDFSGAGNWSGTNWTVTGGVATHTAGANEFVHTLAAVVGTTYQIKATVVTTTAGELQAKIGGVTGPKVGQSVETLTQHTWVFTATSTDTLRFVPNSTWVGTIDNVTVKIITPSNAIFVLNNSDGTGGIEMRSGGSNLSYNTFVGKDAGIATFNNNLGSDPSRYNTALGDLAFNWNTLGFYNTAVGHAALRRNTTGNTNTAIGRTALNNNTTGSYNTALGSGALNSNTTGTHNIASGVMGLSYNTTGSNNTILGNFTGYSNTTGSNNVLLGSMSGFTNQTGTSNIFLGYRSGFFETGSNKLFIDNAQRASEADGRTKALIYGIFDASVANQYLTVNGQLQVTGTGTNYLMGNVGIGTTAPSYKLDINAGIGNALNIASLNQDNQRGINLTVSADTDGDDVYGMYNTVNAGTGNVSGDRNAYGIYNDITNDAIRNTNTPWAVGVLNKLTQTVDGTGASSYKYVNGMTNNIYQDSDYGIIQGVINVLKSSTSNYSKLYYFRNAMSDYFGGDNSVMYGLSNDLFADGSNQNIYGVWNDLAGLGTAGKVENFYGVYNRLYSKTNDQTLFGMYVQDYDTYSTGGTQYGVYIDLNDPQVTNWGIYEIGGATNYFSGNVGIGTTSPKTKLEVDGVIKTTPRSSATCDSNSIGGIYYDTEDNHFYGCKATGWVQLDN